MGILQGFSGEVAAVAERTGPALLHVRAFRPRLPHGSGVMPSQRRSVLRVRPAELVPK